MTIEELNELCDQQISDGRFNQAIATANMVLDQDDCNVTAWVNFAFAELQLKDYNNAKKHAEQAIRLDSKDPVAYDILGKVALHNKQYEHAIEHFDKAIYNGRVGMTVFYDRAYAYAKFGLKSKAIADLVWIASIEHDEYDVVMDLMHQYHLIAPDYSFISSATAPEVSDSHKRKPQVNDDNDDEEVDEEVDFKRRKVHTDDGLSAEVSTLRAQLLQMTEQLNALSQNSELKQITDNLKDRMSQLEDLSVQVGAVQQQQATHETQLTQLTQDLAAQVGAVQQHQATHGTQLTQLTQDLASQVGAVQQRQAAQGSHITRLTNETLNIHERLELQEANQTRLSTQVERLSQREVLALAPDRFFGRRIEDDRPISRAPVVAGTPRSESR